MDNYDNDSTETLRRIATAMINGTAGPRAELEARYGTVWDTEELKRDFEVLGFSAPCVVVRWKSNGEIGTLMFQHSPRFYFQFEKA